MSQNQSGKSNSSQSDKTSSEYVNVGLQRWERLRAEWRRPKTGIAIPRPEVYIFLLPYIHLIKLQKYIIFLRCMPKILMLKNIWKEYFL